MWTHLYVTFKKLGHLHCMTGLQCKFNELQYTQVSFFINALMLIHMWKLFTAVNSLGIYPQVQLASFLTWQFLSLH